MVKQPVSWGPFGSSVSAFGCPEGGFRAPMRSSGESGVALRRYMRHVPSILRSPSSPCLPRGDAMTASGGGVRHSWLSAAHSSGPDNRLCQRGQLATRPSSGASAGIGGSGSAGSGTEPTSAPVDRGRRGAGYCRGTCWPGRSPRASAAGGASPPGQFHSPRRDEIQLRVPVFAMLAVFAAAATVPPHSRLLFSRRSVPILRKCCARVPEDRPQDGSVHG